jgi:hypothetical protein
MKIFWLVAKYMPDVRRREPDNVGVILFLDGRAYHRFRGQRSDGTIDGRRIKWAGSVANFNAWVSYWNHVAASSSVEAAVETLTKQRGDENYLVEFGGERLLGSGTTDPDDLLDELYGVLVEEETERGSLSVVKLAESLLSRLDISERVSRAVRLDVPVDDGAIRDAILFDYRFDNGKANLIQRVSLTVPDERSWDVVHATAWSFRAGKDAQLEVPKEKQFIALVKPREQDAQLNAQMALLARHAEVVSLADESSASSHLAQLLHL